MYSITKKQKHYIWMILISFASLFLRYQFREFVSRDMELYLLPWYAELSELGWRDALKAQIGDYNIFYQLVILFLTRIPGEAIIKYKSLSVFFDYVLAGGVYAFVKLLTDEKKL